MKLAFEQQRLPSSKKTKKWAEDQMNAICSRADEFGSDWYRMWRNYRLKNNLIDQAEYMEYCDTLGVKEAEGNKFVEPFNKTHTIIDVLKGEENAMPWSFGVVNLSPRATNDLLREKNRLYRKRVDDRLNLEISKQTELSQVLAQQEMQGAMGEGADPQQVQQQMQEINAKYDKKLKKILSPEQIEDKFADYKSVKEQTMHKLLQAVVVRNNIKWIKNQTFEDVTLAGVEAVEIKHDEFSGMPFVKQMNVLNLFFHKSTDEPFIHYGDYAGYKEEVSISTALDTYGEVLDDSQVKRLRTFNGAVFGTEASYFNEHSPSHWDNINKYEYRMNPYAVTPTAGTNNVLSEGLYATDRWRRRNEGFCVVYTAYWKSYRRIGLVKTTDEFGEPIEYFVGEEFKIPKRAVRERNTINKYTKKVETYHVWEDNNGVVLKLKWIWIPEVWKGVRINGDIHVYANPIEHAYQSLENPYKVKLPIMGFVYNNRNALSLSIMDRMMPWQKLYFIVAAKWLKLITQDKGVIMLLNTLMVDKSLTLEQSLSFAVDQGILPYNPLSKTQQVGGVVGQMKAAEMLNLSNSQQLTYYSELLNFIEQQLKLAAGISEQRLAQTSRSSNVTDNQRDMAQSMNITNAIFSAHDILWQEILQALCESLVKAVTGKSDVVRQILSDDEIALINLGMIDLDDEYSIRVGNNSKSMQTLQEMKGLSQALLQNDKASFSTLLELFTTDNVGEFKDQLKSIEAELDRRQQSMQQSQQEMQQKEMEQAKQIEEARMNHEKEIARIKGEYDIEKAKISAMAWAEDKDVDKDGKPDVLEIPEHEQRMRESNEKMINDKTKLVQEQEKINMKKQEMGIKQTKDGNDAVAKQRDLDLKKEQIKNQKNKPKS